MRARWLRVFTLAALVWVGLATPFAGAADAAGRSREVASEGDARAASEGCTVTIGQYCRYTATRSGGIEAIGNTWRVKIVRRGVEFDKLYEAWCPSRRCENVLFKIRNAIRKGDRVYVRSGDTVRHAISFADWPPAAFGYVGAGPDYND
jgi:hypothetical protein